MENLLEKAALIESCNKLNQASAKISMEQTGLVILLVFKIIQSYYTGC